LRAPWADWLVRSAFSAIASVAVIVDISAARKLRLDPFYRLQPSCLSRVVNLLLSLRPSTSRRPVPGILLVAGAWPSVLLSRPSAPVARCLFRLDRPSPLSHPAQLPALAPPPFNPRLQPTEATVLPPGALTLPTSTQPSKIPPRKPSATKEKRNRKNSNKIRRARLDTIAPLLAGLDRARAW